jgi:hypothetical protein
MDEGRLARTVGADDGMQLAGLDGQAHIVRDNEGAVGFPHMAEFEKGLSHDEASAAGP